MAEAKADRGFFPRVRGLRGRVCPCPPPRASWRSAAFLQVWVSAFVFLSGSPVVRTHINLPCSSERPSFGGGSAPRTSF